MASVDFDVRDHIGHIVINNPEKRNSVNAVMVEQLHEIYEEVVANRDIRVAVVSGAGGKSFCAGGNIPDYAGKVTGESGSGQRNVLPKPWRISKPFIAAIEGYAVGGGFGLALSCDLRVASRSSRMGLSGLKRGVVNGATQTTHLVRLVGVSNAMEALLTSEYMSAEKASRIGLVQKLVDDGGAVEAAMEWATTIAGFSPEAVAGTKRMAYDTIDLTWDQAHRWEEDVTAHSYRTADAEEGYSSFNEKRPAEFGKNPGGLGVLGMDESWPLSSTPTWR